MEPKVLDELRSAIERSGLSLNEIDRQAGIDPAITSRLMRGGNLSLANADRLATALGLQLTVKRARKPANSKKKGA
ncbi:MAG: helix-turn-helix domain-containing protein [Phycisphaerales bacterium]